MRGGSQYVSGACKHIVSPVPMCGYPVICVHVLFSSSQAVVDTQLIWLESICDVSSSWFEVIGVQASGSSGYLCIRVG